MWPSPLLGPGEEDVVHVTNAALGRQPDLRLAVMQQEACQVAVPRNPRR